MTCDEAAELLAERVDGELAPLAARELHAHLAGCAACASLRRRLEAVVAALHEMAAQTRAPGDLGDRVAASVLLPRGPSIPMPWRDLRRVAGWGLVMMGLGWQLGGGALAARAVGQAAPVIAEARQAVARSRHEGIVDELERATHGVTRLAQDVRSAAALGQSAGDAR